jgi:tyrosyl-tRNA synthetase
LHPSDLKIAVASALNDLLQPVRDHFNNDPYAKNLLATIRGWNEEIAKKKAAE